MTNFHEAHLNGDTRHKKRKKFFLRPQILSNLVKDFNAKLGRTIQYNEPIG